MGKRIVLSTGNLVKLVGLLYVELAKSALSLVPTFKQESKRESRVPVRASRAAA